MNNIVVRNTPAFKLKDRDGRRFVSIDLVKQFGFVPETIIVERIKGSKNVLIVRAVLTQEEMKRDLEISKKNKPLASK